MRINKGQKYVLRELRSSGRPLLLTTSDDKDALIKEANKHKERNKNKNIYGFKVCQRTGGGRYSEETIYSCFKD